MVISAFYFASLVWFPSVRVRAIGDALRQIKISGATNIDQKNARKCSQYSTYRNFCGEWSIFDLRLLDCLLISVQAYANFTHIRAVISKTLLTFFFSLAPGSSQKTLKHSLSYSLGDLLRLHAEILAVKKPTSLLCDSRVEGHYMNIVINCQTVIKALACNVVICHFLSRLLLYIMLICYQ